MVKIYHCAVLGDPILHSLSPVLHNTAYKALGLTNWQYSKEKVSETDPVSYTHLRAHETSLHLVCRLLLEKKKKKKK